MAMHYCIEAENLTAYYKKKWHYFLALKTLSCRIPAGYITGIVGASGAGKTTFLRCVMGIQTYSSGILFVNGCKRQKNNIQLYPQDVQIMGQDAMNAINPQYTVEQCLQEMLQVQKIPKSMWNSEIDRVLHDVHMPIATRKKYRKQLSGGQIQRVMFARMLLSSAPLWLLDEPFANLDPLLQTQMENLLYTIQNKYNKSIVLVSHDITSVLRICSYIFVMNNATIIDYGACDEIQQIARDPYTIELLHAHKHLYSLLY